MGIEDGESPESKLDQTQESAEISVEPEYHVEIEQEGLVEFARFFSNKIFVENQEYKHPERQDTAQDILKESLVTQMVFTIAQRRLRNQGEDKPIDQINDPMKRFKAIQDAQNELHQKKRDGSDSQDIKFARQLLGEDDLKYGLMAAMGWHDREYDTLDDNWKTFLVEHLNEINLVNLARLEDEQATQEQKRGRLFGTKKENEWLLNVLKMNGFTEEDGLFLPKEMAEEAKDEYLSAFETYRQLFSEKNTSDRQRLNESQIKAIEELEGLIAEYENVEQIRYKTDELDSGVTNAQSVYDEASRSLANTRINIERAETRLEDANFLTRGARRREVEALKVETPYHERWLGQAAQQLSEAQAQHQKAKNAPEEKKRLESELQRRARSSHIPTVRQRVEELKSQPKY